MVFSNTLLAGSAAQGDSVYKIDQSIRFNSADSPYMSRTPSSTGNRKTFTSSCWVKLGDLTNCALPMPTVAQTASYGMYLASGIIQVFIYYTGSAWQGQLYTNRVFRDPSAWFHLVTVVDTTQAISSERVRFYVNGQRETSFSTENYPNQNQDTDWNNSGEAMGIGVNANGFSGSFGEYYAAEMHYLDGLAYGPEFFGETNDNGIWVPKEYTGSYGTNGFYIKGADASALGTDSSGNGNNFTTSGLAAHDQMADSPSNNHAVMNILDTRTTANWTASNGNLDVYWQGNSYPNPLFSTLSMPATGKWYFEIEFDTDGSGNVLTNQNMRIGLMREDINAAYVEANASTDLTTSSTSPEIIVVLGNAGNSCQLKGMGSNIYNVGGSISAGDRINFAREGANLWIGKNGTYYNSGNPATGSNPTLSNLQLEGYRANMQWSTGNTSANCIVKAYFGADKSIGSGTGFNDTVPSGFLALNTTNLGS